MFVGSRGSLETSLKPNALGMSLEACICLFFLHINVSHPKKTAAS